MSKSTEEYLRSLENKVEEDIANYVSGKDELDRVIFRENLRISSVFFDSSVNLMLVVLNNGKVIKRKLSDFSILANASKEQLQNYRNEGMGVHWPAFDYDLSLKGFLQFELINKDTFFTV
jgi:hypothetical protein